MLHLFALLVAASTAVLIFAGGLVTSTGSGLSVPDWPNTYGWFMFTFPLEKMVGGIFYEHTHRLIASTVGFLILVLAVVAVAGGTARAGCAGSGFVALAAVDHAGHPRRHHGAVVPAGSDLDRPRQPGADRLLPDDGDRAGHVSGMDARRTPRAAACRTTATLAARRRRDHRRSIYLQIVIGATMRHTDAGLAIPDFPLAFGHLMPPQWDAEDRRSTSRIASARWS